MNIVCLGDKKDLLAVEAILLRGMAENFVCHSNFSGARKYVEDHQGEGGLIVCPDSMDEPNDVLRWTVKLRKTENWEVVFLSIDGWEQELKDWINKFVH